MSLRMSEQSSDPKSFPAHELVEGDDLPRIVPGSADQGEVEILREELIWENDAVRLFKDHVRYPATKDRKHVEDDVFRLTDAPGKMNGVITIPITHDDRIILVRQFRHPARMWMLELPRGSRNPGESPEAAAAREIHEEIGCRCTATESLGRVSPDSGQLSSIPHIIAARVRRDGAPEREETETIDRTVAMPYAILRSACERGEILDGYTLAAVTRIAPLVRDGRIVLECERSGRA